MMLGKVHTQELSLRQDVEALQPKHLQDDGPMLVVDVGFTSYPTSTVHRGKQFGLYITARGPPAE